MNPQLRPGQEFKTFAILKKAPTLSSAGSPGKSTAFMNLGTLKGALTTASPKEKEEWKQNGHEVSNKIVQYFSKLAEEGQYLQVTNPDNSSTTYRIEGVKNPGELNHFAVYYVIEKKGLQYETIS